MSYLFIYLFALVYFLLHGTWIRSDMHPNPINEHTYERRWGDFMTQTTNVGYEFCDCCRPGVAWESTTENRYFYDSCLDNMITYIQIFETPQGRVDPNTAFERIRNFKEQPAITPCSSSWDPFVWQYRKYDGYADVIRHVARNLTMQPTHAVLNHGLWRGRWFDNATRRWDLLQALKGQHKDSGGVTHKNKEEIVGIWKTTTVPQNKKTLNQEDDDEMRKFFLDNGQLVLDVSWTGQSHPTVYWDKFHFWENPYRVMSEDLLILLGHKFPPSYSTFDRTKLFFAQEAREHIR